MGGYDFPGSTSAEDLSVLTGWIPERIGFKDAKTEFNVEREFDRLVSGAKFGDCLVEFGHHLSYVVCIAFTYYTEQMFAEHRSLCLREK